VGAVTLVAVVLRVLLMVAYVPAILSYPDESSYVEAAAGSLFGNPFRPAGYSLFLRIVHVVSANLQFTIAVQHVIGLLTAVGVYALARRIGAGRWTALLPAALVAVSGDQLYLEHVLLSDGLYLTIIVLATYCALRVLDASPERPGRMLAGLGWALAAGVAIAALTSVRTLGVALAPVLVLWLLVVGGPKWRRRVLLAGLAAAACGLLLLGYAFAQKQATGVFGLSRFSGWPLYARVATFADCRKFTPPPGTRVLCQPTPSSLRPGPAFYIWNSRSPAERAFGFPPAHGALLARFADAAILGQPLDYLYTASRDLLRYVYPHLVHGPDWGTEPQLLTLNTRSRSIEALNRPSVQAYWHPPPVKLRHGILDALERWRSVFVIHGWMLAVSTVLALSGLALSPDRRTRQALALLTVGALVLLVVSVAVTNYDYRNGIPSSVLLLVAAARSVEILWPRARQLFGRAAG